MFTIKKYI